MNTSVGSAQLFWLGLVHLYYWQEKACWIFGLDKPFNCITNHIWEKGYNIDVLGTTQCCFSKRTQISRFPFDRDEKCSSGVWFELQSVQQRRREMTASGNDEVGVEMSPLGSESFTQTHHVTLPDRHTLALFSLVLHVSSAASMGRGRILRMWGWNVTNTFFKRIRTHTKRGVENDIH